MIKKNILLLITSIPILVYFFLIIFNLIYKIEIDIPKISVYCANFIIIPCLFYVFCLILYHLQNINEPLRKKVLKIFLIFLLLYAPFALIDCFYDTFIFIFKYLPDGFSFSAFYYILGNIVSLFLCRKYLLIPNSYQSKELSKDIIKKYKITSREKEIAIFVMDGYSNKEISDKAFISTTTVKKHVYNIFQKTGAKNRVDLINILKNNVKSTLTN